MSDHIADKAGFLAALPKDDPERLSAEDHIRSCPPCGSALAEGRRLTSFPPGAWQPAHVAIVDAIGRGDSAAARAAMALHAGAPVDAPAGGVAADSLAPKQVGRLMFPLAQQYVDAALLVSDEAIVEAQHALWKNLRIVVEPGGAAALAAVLSGVFETKPGQRIGIVLCGANTSAVQLSKAAG